MEAIRSSETPGTTQRTTRRHIPEDDTLYKNSVYTSQETHHVSTTKPNRLMLFRETIAVYFENHTEHTDTLCGQNTEFWYVNVGSVYRITGPERVKILFSFSVRTNIAGWSMGISNVTS
jgi:hypothetical protein